MQITHNGQNKDISLGFTSTEYNCSVKLIGRLKIMVNGKEGYLDAILSTEFNKPNVKKALIAELAGKMVQNGTYPPLNTTSPYFPHDNGHYLPNYLLYADSIALPKDAHWCSSFKAFIREVQNNPEHGFKVFELPMYSNNTYGNSLWPSKVWGIVPPAMTKKLIIPGVLSDTGVIQGIKALKGTNINNTYSEKDLGIILDAASSKVG
jgi:hypothetical protein